MSETDEVVDKLCSMCSLLIERRENYQYDNSFTHIVDRFQLVRKTLLL